MLSLLASNLPSATLNSPIICICYTNHALDSFLEELLDNGVPVADIIRLGGRCSNEKVSACTLQNRQQTLNNSGLLPAIVRSSYNSLT